MVQLLLVELAGSGFKWLTILGHVFVHGPASGILFGNELSILKFKTVLNCWVVLFGF